MSFLIRLDRWFSKIHHDRLVARLRASVTRQRTHLELLEELDPRDMTPKEREEWRDEKGRVIMIITHLEGLIKSLKIDDNLFMSI